MSDTPDSPRDSYVPPVVDESRDFNFGIQDVLLGILTLPLLLFAMQYAFSGSEKIVATPQARLKLYGVLFALELLVAIVIYLVFIR